MSECASSERKNINREWGSLFITHTLTHWGAWVREKFSQVRERERTSYWRSSLCFWVLLLPLVLILSLRKLWGFFLYKLFYYVLTISGTLVATLDILCHLKNFKFLWIFGLLHVVSEHKVETLGLNVSQLTYVEQ